MLQRRFEKGFTMVELMITIVIAAIVLALAVPSYKMFVEKRQLTAAAEDLANYIGLAQSLAVKRNDPINMSWQWDGGHDDNFCIGLTEGTAECDCWETDPTDGDFCAVGDIPYRLTKTDFVNVGHEFMHFNPAEGDFSFDPIRGNVNNWSSSEIVDGDWLMYMHSNEGSGSSRLFGLEVRMWVTGKVEICYQESRKMIIGGYPDC